MTLRQENYLLKLRRLHEQQMEKSWSRGFPGEGVVLKKRRDNFTCAPESLATESNFYDMVVAMNVRVSIPIGVYF